MPWIAEAKLHWECSGPKPGETCLTRMRVMGHVWSRKGDMAKAKDWYGQAAVGGDPQAMFHLAWIHEQAAIEDTKEHFRRMAEKLASADGGPIRVSSTSERGRRNIDLAKEWYQKSADLGFAPSMNNLGQIYLYGLGRLQERGCVRPSYGRSKGRQSGGGMDVAIAYSAGVGVDPDPAEVKKWRTWTPPAEIMPDLLEPTLARTKLYGSTLTEAQRANLRATTELGEPATFVEKPMKADPSLPSFHEATEKMWNQQRSSAQTRVFPVPRRMTGAASLPEDCGKWEQRFYNHGRETTVSSGEMSEIDRLIQYLAKLPGRGCRPRVRNL